MLNISHTSCSFPRRREPSGERSSFWVPAFAGMMGLGLFSSACSNETLSEKMNWKCFHDDRNFYELISIDKESTFVEVSMYLIKGELPDVRHGNAKFKENSVELTLYEIPKFYGKCSGVIDLNTGLYDRECNSISETTNEVTTRKSQLQCTPLKEL